MSNQIKKVILSGSKQLVYAMGLLKKWTGTKPEKVMQLITLDKLRNLEQNALFHVLIAQMSEQSTHAGDGAYISPKVMKEWVCCLYLKSETIYLPNGTQSVKRQSTTKLSMRDFTGLINHTLAMAMEMDMQITMKDDRHRRFIDGDKGWYL